MRTFSRNFDWGIIALLLLLPGILPARQLQKNTIEWVVQKNTSLTVKGKSNVNKFTCSIDEYTNNDTILVWADKTKPVKLSGTLQMNVLAFDCRNSLITKDLQKTLKSEDYPLFSIRFLSLDYLPLLNSKNETARGWVEVELAGTVKKIEIFYTFSKAGKSLFLLMGSSNFCFSDFNLSPPRKLAGLIKIEDDFEVNFKLTLKAMKV